MNSKLNKLLLAGLILLMGIFLGFFSRHNNTIWHFIKKTINSINQQDYRESKPAWTKDYELIEIPSKLDNTIQKAYFYKSNSSKPQPLIVSLHPWNGDYSQFDSLSALCLKKNLNYIHPDFRGANHTPEACCSILALNDIDEAITYAIQHSNIDTSNIFVIGASGGGYATLCYFLKSKRKIKKYSAWASICDLEAWYNECKIMGNKYTEDILKCTKSKNGILNSTNAIERSPIYWKVESSKISNTELTIYAGIYDGIQGPASISQSINFYNKLLDDQSVKDSTLYVSNSEKLFLLEHRKPLGEYGKIADRIICLKKQYNTIRLIIYTGGHEILNTYALEQLLKSDN